MKNKLDINIHADAEGGQADLKLMGDDFSAVMDTLHDAVVEIGQWAGLPPTALLSTIISVIAVEEYQERKAAESVGGREEERGDQETGQADLRAGQGVAHYAGEGAGEADEKG